MCIESLFHWKAPLIVNDPMNTSPIPQTMNQFMHRLTLHEQRAREHSNVGHTPWVFRSWLEKAMMRISPLNAMSVLRVTLSMGLIGLLFAPLLHAQEYPADITRGKDVYQRNCQACHGVGGWGDGPDAKGLKVAPAGSGGACNSGLQYSRWRLKSQRLPRTLVQA